MAVRLTGWSQSGKLRPGIVGPGVGLQAVFGEMGNYTVQLGLDDTYEHQALEFTRARAEVLWSVKGNTIRRLVDCVSGTSVTGTAEAVAVKITDVSSFVGAAAAEYLVSIEVAKGTRPSVERPPTLTAATFSGQSVMVAGVGTTDVEVPQNAGVISVMVTVAPDTIGTAVGAYDVLVNQVNQAGNTLRTYDPRQTDWVPLAPGCTTIVFTQGAAAPATRWSAIFGIDG